MMMNDESGMATLDYVDEHTKQLNNFRNRNERYLSTMEIEQLINHIQMQNMAQSSVIKTDQDHVAASLYLLQDIIDSIVPVIEIDRCAAILTLFDALNIEKFNATMQSAAPYEYVDIADINLLSKLDKVHSRGVIIGVNASFMNALERCSEWNLYSIAYDDVFPLQAKVTCDAPILQLSALGLLKRIISSQDNRSIRFFFKDHNKGQKISLEKLTSLCNVTMSVQVDAALKQTLGRLPYLLKHYVENQLRKSSIHQAVVIRLFRKTEVRRTTDRVKEEQFYKEFFDYLVQIQHSRQYHHRLMLLLQEEIDHQQYITYEWNEGYKQHHDYARAHNQSKTVIDTLREAWMKQVLIVTI